MQKTTVLQRFEMQKTTVLQRFEMQKTTVLRRFEMQTCSNQEKSPDNTLFRVSVRGLFILLFYYLKYFGFFRLLLSSSCRKQSLRRRG